MTGESSSNLPKVPWGVRDVVIVAVSWIALQFALVIGLAVAGAFVPVIRQMILGLIAGDIVASFGLSVAVAVLGIGLVMWRVWRHGAGWKELGWRRVSILKTLGYVLGILVIFVVAANVLLFLVSVFVPSFDANQVQQTNFNNAKTDTARWLAFVALVLLPPVLEETIFRGFMFPALAKRWGVMWGAVLSSVLFALAHWQANISLYTLPLGLLLCFMYVRLRSIVPGVMLHMANNYLAFVALMSSK